MSEAPRGYCTTVCLYENHLLILFDIFNLFPSTALLLFILYIYLILLTIPLTKALLSLSSLFPPGGDRGSPWELSRD